VADEGGRRRMIEVKVDYARLAGAAAAIVLVVWFALANRHEVTITWWLFDWETSLILVIVVSAALGAVAGALATIRRNRSR
jgi:uncharacterized integral membrane protein